MTRKRLRVLLMFEVNEPPVPEAEYERYMETDETWFTEGHVLAALREKREREASGAGVATAMERMGGNA